MVNGKGKSKLKKFCIELGASGTRAVYVFAPSESAAKATVAEEISNLLGSPLIGSELTKIADAPIKEVEVIGPKYNL